MVTTTITVVTVASKIISVLLIFKKGLVEATKSLRVKTGQGF